MELLDRANTAAFGDAVAHAGAALTSKKARSSSSPATTWHDLQQLLEQTKERGVNVYTHSEMLPAHGYPGAEKIPAPGRATSAPAGRTSRRSSTNIPAPILFTTNCLMPPRPSYRRPRVSPPPSSATRGCGTSRRTSTGARTSRPLIEQALALRRLRTRPAA